MLRLSKEYGLNPSITQCPVCGEDDCIVLFGAGYKDEKGHTAKAPMKLGIISLEPCSKCKERYLKDGVLMYEATEPGKPTGNLLIIRDEAFSRIFNVPIPEGKIACIDPEAFAMLNVKEESNG